MKLPPKNLILFFLILTIGIIPLFILAKNIQAQTGTQKCNPWNVTIECAIEENRKLDEEQQKNPNATIIADTLVHDRGFDLTLIKMIKTIVPIPDLSTPEATVLETLAKVMGEVYTNPPATTAFWLRDTLATAGLARPVYAQGIGFAALSPLLTIWKASRNTAYAVLIIVMIAIGFMIIFRMKIDPKTVISIQAALPRIIITLLLITFSYPIVGFLIDIMYLSMAIIISLMVEGIGGSFAGQTANLQSQFMTGDLVNLFGWVWGPAAWSAVNIGQGLFWGIIGSGAGIGTVVSGFFGKIPAFITPIWGQALAAAAPVLLLILIIVLGVIFTFIRLLFLLVNSYIQILISLILAPIILLGEAIPGRSAFTEWVQNLIANLVVFPATVAVFIFAMFLAQLAPGSSLWTPPFLAFPIVGTAGPNIFGAFLGLTVIFMAPSLVAQIKKAFHPKPALPVTAGTAFAPLTGGIQSGMGAMQSFYYIKMSGSSIPFIGKKLFGDKQ